jgi:uncharacterized protein (DUF2336 family)
MNKAARKTSNDEAALTYEESKRLLQDDDPEVRARLAGRDDVKPEILYYLAEDDSVEVRRRLATNDRTPPRATLILACDDDESVRGKLAAKVARLTSQLSQHEQARAQRYVLETLEILARDQATLVRGIMADALKDVVDAPASVIQRLARDVEEVVSCPVLEFSPLLTEEDLLDIIDDGCVTGKLQAISRRKSLVSPVADAIVGTDDEAAITALLANESAQIREETLDELIEKAPKVAAWHAPLVSRPRLSSRAAIKLASFVADVLLRQLRARHDLDRDAARRVAIEVNRRLDIVSAKGETGAEAMGEEKAMQLHGAGELDAAALNEALAEGDCDFVRCALALRAQVTDRLVEKILRSGSPKGVTALAWKAKTTMRFAVQLQLRMGGISPMKVLDSGNGKDFPIEPAEMRWQLEFFKNL